MSVKNGVFVRLDAAARGLCLLTLVAAACSEPQPPPTPHTPRPAPETPPPAPPPLLELHATDLFAGLPVQLSVQVGPGDTVAFAYGTAGIGAGPCVPATAICLDLASPVSLLGSTTADPTGLASLATTVSAGAPVGTPVYFQAVVASGGAVAKTTWTSGTVMGPSVDADGDGFAAAVDCDDGNASIYPGAPDPVCDGVDSDCDGDDDVDLDLDGRPDECDPCPLDPTDTCDHQISLWLQVDFWNNEAAWLLYESPSGLPVDNGNFTAPNREYTRFYALPVGASYCVRVSDSYGDGGVAGRVEDVDAGTVLTEWQARDYTVEIESCFTVTGLP